MAFSIHKNNNNNNNKRSGYDTKLRSQGYSGVEPYLSKGPRPRNMFTLKEMVALQPYMVFACGTWSGQSTWIGDGEILPLVGKG